MSDIDYESEARQQGWVPKEEFRGNENEWVSAEDFVERGRQILPIMRANYDRLKKEFSKEREAHQRELEDVKKTAAEFKEFQKEAFERKKKEFDAEIQRLRAEKAQAISDGDGERVSLIEDRIDDLKDQKAQSIESAKSEPAPAQPVQGADPVLQSWVDKHSSWFGVNKRATAMVNAIASELREKEPALVGPAFLDKLDSLLEEDEDVSKFLGKQKRQSPVNSGTTNVSTVSKTKQVYENLPADAKAACDKYVKQNLMTREEYVSAYDWS